MALQFPLKLDAPEQSTKADNSGSTTIGGRGFVVGIMFSRHYIAKVGCSLNVRIDLAPIIFFALRSLVAAFVQQRTIVVRQQDEFMQLVVA
jgi:hypothetical protein